ncbi:sugar ABC transporter permease [Kitasatospora sp. YST-16]|uniref:carbohydrate ABC transporter permease n=1 Tax=unclassified Kitasatospora TaxID=2633591 RepID=UPI0009DF829F|nr:MULTISPECIES: sugar ABC transporter permease [unclassified Kitasatospora]WAL70562.1 sugar ABC transporter permease [Kitasatospora sp. YST-16]WNW36602.1 sugar ABC transporter permease [Streptomyces sp. Li-HN-5-13]
MTALQRDRGAGKPPAQAEAEAGDAVPAGRRRAPRRKALRRHWWFTPWLYLVVPLAFLVTFTYLPIGDMIGYSFTDWDGISPERNNVGLKNYTDLFTRPELFKVFLVSGVYLIAAVLQIALALYFATVLSFNTRFRNLFKGILFFPYLINGVAIGFVFLFFFQPHGTLDSLLSMVGVHGKHQWLGDPDLVNKSLAGVSVWRYTGLNLVLFLGAIQSIPPHLYEAAALDGANRWQQFRHIIAPSIKPVISLSAILAVSGSLAVFEIPYIMTGGSNGSQTFVIQSINMAFKFDKFGLASASAVVLIVLILIVTWIQRRLVPEERVELS